jgi:hypothetical protein
MRHISYCPFGPFERVGKILQHDSTDATGAGHHSIIHNTKKGLWYIVYHRRPLGETEGNNSAICIEQLFFDYKGFIMPVKLSFTGVPQQNLQ